MIQANQNKSSIPMTRLVRTIVLIAITIFVQWQYMRSLDLLEDAMMQYGLDVDNTKHVTADHVLRVKKRNITDYPNITDFPIPVPNGTHVILEPTFGKHRENDNVDAIFSLIGRDNLIHGDNHRLDLTDFTLFIESLKETGFNGDLVLGIYKNLDTLRPGVEEYLRSHQSNGNESGLNIVVYSDIWTSCYKNRTVTQCSLVGMYGKDTDEDGIVTIADPRRTRSILVSQFELFWVWSQYYKDENWIMLIDFNDAYFQLNPFSALPKEVDGGKGLLYFFENAEWVTRTCYERVYGGEKIKSFMYEQILSSSSTMGQRIAMDKYLRAMVAQFDATLCDEDLCDQRKKKFGCEQAFHNYLYYSNSLSNLNGVKEVKVFTQGNGIINNLNLRRSKSLRQQGLLDKKFNVLNWDKSLSAVAYRFHHDYELKDHLDRLRLQYEPFKFEEERPMNEVSEFGSPALEGINVILEPTFGKHRPHVDAIFAVAKWRSPFWNYSVGYYLLFIESLQETGFKGDLVLSVGAIGSLKDGVEDYLRSFQLDENEVGLNVVVYTVTWDCSKELLCNLVNFYGNETENEAIKDPREARPMTTARFELYWAWSQHYDKHNWIMLTDTFDAYFQLDPFAKLDHTDNEGEKDDGLLYFFAENTEDGLIGNSSYFDVKLLKEAYGMYIAKSFLEKPIISSWSTMGQNIALEPYLRAMIAQFDNTNCKLYGCDLGFHNYLYYTNALTNGLKGIREVVVFEQGKGIINNLGMLRTKPLREWGLLNDSNLVLNWDGEVSPVAMHYGHDDELNKHVSEARKVYTQKFWAGKTRKSFNFANDAADLVLSDACLDRLMEYVEVDSLYENDPFMILAKLQNKEDIKMECIYAKSPFPINKESWDEKLRNRISVLKMKQKVKADESVM